jgi:small conductance mechanosensitive channel
MLLAKFIRNSRLVVVMAFDESVIGQIWTYGSELVQGIIAKVIVAFIILLIGFILARIVNKLILRLFKELNIDVLFKKAGVKISLGKIVASFIQYFIYLISIILALDQLGIRTAVLNMLGAAIIVIFIILIVLAVKDFVPNFFSGIFIFQKKYFKEGELIKVKGVVGTVKEITLLETKIETESGDVLLVPNSALTKTEIVKINKTKKKRK